MASRHGLPKANDYLPAIAPRWCAMLRAMLHRVQCAPPNIPHPIWLPESSPESESAQTCIDNYFSEKSQVIDFKRKYYFLCLKFKIMAEF
jgi:hypothetical protein